MNPSSPNRNTDDKLALSSASFAGPHPPQRPDQEGLGEAKEELKEILSKQDGLPTFDIGIAGKKGGEIVIRVRFYGSVDDLSELPDTVRGFPVDYHCAQTPAKALND